jgi:hypothetical protein
VSTSELVEEVLLSADRQQRYRLRLRDGTLLVVDYDGLTTWLVDSSAMVQAVGAREWRPLKEYLAELRVTAAYQEKQRAAAAEARPPAPVPAEEPADSPASEEPESGGADVRIDLGNDRFEADPVGRPPSLQVLADEPSLSRTARAEPRSASDGGLAAMLLKPLDADEFPEPSVDFGDEPLVYDKPGRRGFEDGFLRAFHAFDGIATQWVEHLARWADKWTQASASARTSARATRRRATAARERSAPPQAHSPLGLWGSPPPPSQERSRHEPVREREPLEEPVAPPAAYAPRDPEVEVLAEASTSRGEYVRERSPTGEGLRILRLKPVEDELHGLALFHRLRRWLSPWIALFRSWTDRMTRSEAPPAAVPQDEAPPPVVFPPGDPLQRPLKISELPVLRLAKIEEPEIEGDLYDGEYEDDTIDDAVWIWAKRLVWTTALSATVAIAALTWDHWSPKAVQLGWLLFTEIDTRERSERQGRALAAAAERLPHLAPDTIRLILSQSPDGVLEPSQVFRLAYSAAERGRRALAPEEAQELQALRESLVQTLRPVERERVSEYESASVQRTTLPFEDRDMLDLFARGSAGLEAQARERLRALTGKAIAAGLALPAEEPPSSAP